MELVSISSPEIQEAEERLTYRYQAERACDKFLADGQVQHLTLAIVSI